MRPLRQEQGYTLVEMLISMVIAVILFGSVLTALDQFTNSWQGMNERLDAQDQARLAIDRIVRQLRNIASPVTTPKLLERATPYDLVFQTVATPVQANVTGAERVRYCISTTAPGTTDYDSLIGETETWNTLSVPTSPWTSDPNTTIPCPDNASGVTTTIVASSITNTDSTSDKGQPRPAFTYNNGTAPSDLSQVFSVQIDLFVNPTTRLPAAETEIKSGAFLRNQPRAPVAYVTDTPTGNGGVLLNGATSYSPDGENLSYSWSCTSPSPCPAASSLASATTGLVAWQPGPGTYTVQLVVTDEAGLISPPATQVVTVT